MLSKAGNGALAFSRQSNPLFSAGFHGRDAVSKAGDQVVCLVVVGHEEDADIERHLAIGIAQVDEVSRGEVVATHRMRQPAHAPAGLDESVNTDAERSLDGLVSAVADHRCLQAVAVQKPSEMAFCRVGDQRKAATRSAVRAELIAQGAATDRDQRVARPDVPADGFVERERREPARLVDDQEIGFAANEKRNALLAVHGTQPRRDGLVDLVKHAEHEGERRGGQRMLDREDIAAFARGELRRRPRSVSIRPMVARISSAFAARRGCSAMRLADRSSSGIPTHSSKLRILRENAGCVRFLRAAAALRLPSSSNTRTSSNSRVSMRHSYFFFVCSKIAAVYMRCKHADNAKISAFRRFVGHGHCH